MTDADHCADDTERAPPDPYDPDDAKHIDEFPPFNGGRIASFAFDDEGNRYKVETAARYPSTRLIPERLWRETFMPERDGVGEECRGCGETIEWDAIIVHDEYHLRCYVDTETGRSEADR